MSRKIRIALVSLVSCLILFSIPASAHSGGTDSNGGHTDHSTGEYHYHHGYPAHQHPNGVCPYASTGSGNSSSSESTDSSETSLNRYVQAAITGVPVEDQEKSAREQIETVSPSDSTLNKYVVEAYGQMVADEEAWREENKYYLEMDQEKLVKEYLSMKQNFEAAKSQRDALYEDIDKISIEVAELKGKNTYLKNQNNTLQTEIDLFKDKYLSIGIAVGIALVMGSIILIVRNAGLKRQLASLRKQPNESNSN